MKTSWDFSESLFADSVSIDMQQSRARPKSGLPVGLMAIAVSALFVATESPILTHEVGCGSATVISVQRVKRLQSAPPRTERGSREEYTSDAQHGMSTTRLAKVFSALFVPLEETEPDLDYTFG